MPNVLFDGTLPGWRAAARALLAAGVPPVMALGTNKLQSTFGTAGATFAFWRKGHIDLRRSWRLALASFGGAAIGAALVQAIDPQFLSGLLPILHSQGTGAEVMSRIAAPMVGGMISAPLLSLFVLPAAYYLLRMKRR